MLEANLDKAKVYSYWQENNPVSHHICNRYRAKNMNFNNVGIAGF